MELEIKHLAAYLPYGLKAVNEAREAKVTITGIQVSGMVSHNLGMSNIELIRPILKPLSDLTEEYLVKEFNVRNASYEEYEHYKRASLIHKYKGMYKEIYYGIIDELFERHFDVFGLIEKGLAIDINIIK